MKTYYRTTLQLKGEDAAQSRLDTFGPWRLYVGRKYGHGKTFAALVLQEDRNYVHEVDLALVDCAQAVIVGLVRISHENWATHEVIGGLVRALDEILGMGSGNPRRVGDVVATACAYLDRHPEVEYIGEEVS